jgi:GH35 family endo-1,4-beta-xylanase
MLMTNFNQSFTSRLLFSILFAIIMLPVSSCKKEDDKVSNSHGSSNIEKSLQPNNFPLKKVNLNVMVGAHINNDLTDTNFLAIPKNEFSAIQALYYAGYGGWNGVNDFDYSSLNSTINWIVENGKSAHVHMLVGPDQYMPEWLKEGSWTKQQLNGLLKKQIYTIMDANDNKNKVDVWNVINEVFNDDGTYRTDVLWNQLGYENDASGLTGSDKINNKHPKFIRQAFKFSREKTDAKLEYRDYSIENSNPQQGADLKYKAVYQLLKHMINSNIPIDAVGLQGHYGIGTSYVLTDNNALKNVVEKYKSLGIEVYVTELDFNSQNQVWSPALAQTQKQDYYNYVKQAIEGGASRIYTWGFQDGKDPSWLTNFHPLPWDENLLKKPAYYGIQKALYDTR